MVYGSALLAGGVGYKQSGCLQKLEINVPISGLDRRLNNFKIGIMSDFHDGSWGNSRLIGKAVGHLMALKPDVICLLGDYVDGASHLRKNTLKERPIFNELAKLSAQHGVYAVLGNHDHWIDAPMVTRHLNTENIHVLQNEHKQLANGLVLAGVDDYWEGPSKPRLALKGLAKHQPTVLLSHNPDISHELDKNTPVDIILAGHTHGGQIRIPFCKWAPWVPCSPRYRGQSGLIKERDNLFTFITKGVGTFFLPVRLFCPPDIALLKIFRA